MSDVTSGLDAEWERIASSPEARRAVIRWAADHPPLRELADLREVLERRRDPRHEGEVLSALAALARTDELAARSLLQALLPGIIRLASRAMLDDPGADSELVALAWERIRTYPSGRAGPVAGNVLLDVKKRYRRHRRIDAPRSSVLPASPLLPPRDAHVTRSAEDEALDRISLADFLATQERVVGRRNLRLIVRTRVHGVRLADVAVEEKVSVQTLNVRRRRTELRLAKERLSQLASAG